ncbi:TPA: Eco57I restriction-modification methylase domain-containing protein [Streptococcus suis]|nr:Eco57I restriction-modification methylase domain-containing protein [Streptococcus hyovaginalis]HEM6115830.1 Eco57I restriction-modification methylase domain-containing protein [Streptococcus suis]
MTSIDISEDRLARESSSLLKTLLKDRTTKKSIVWATDSYELLGKGFGVSDSITPGRVTGRYADLIQPRSEKSKIEQKNRTKIRAEVFTPTWLVKQQNGYAEAEFQDLDLEDYLALRWLEITCGEAPYIVTRYDTVSGQAISLSDRVGFLDRKLQRLSREVNDEGDFFRLAKLAYQSSYGYEFQGDSLLLARENLLASFEDYYQAKFDQAPTLKQKEEIAKIISYNVFQMDGLAKTSPFSAQEVSAFQLNLFDEDQAEIQEAVASKTQIKDWTKNKMIGFERLSSEESDMKFDVVIGNPPYQEELQGTSDKPVYNYFIDSSIDVAEKSMLITPARYLFNAGKTEKKWNQKMLNDEHYKVLFYEQNSAKVFSGTDIKGGVAITYYDHHKDFGAIETFTSFEELNSIYKNVYHRDDFKTLSDHIYAPESYKLTEQLHVDYPDFVDRLSKGHKFDVTTNIFEKLPEIFTDSKEVSNSVQIIGRQNNDRVYKFIPKKYIKGPQNFESYKVFLPKANGSGSIGEVLSTPLVGTPLVGHTQTFLSIGNFDTLDEANALHKYIKTKFARTLLGVLKITQDNKKSTWKYVPLQDFTVNSDIDWSQSVAEIDRQLYEKYGLSAEEIAFIETKVKEMD